MPPRMRESMTRDRYIGKSVNQGEYDAPLAAGGDGDGSGRGACPGALHAGAHRQVPQLGLLQLLLPQLLLPHHLQK